jgi:hypothetical protein
VESARPTLAMAYTELGSFCTERDVITRQVTLHGLSSELSVLSDNKR